MILDSLLLYGLVRELSASLAFAQVRDIHQTDARVLDLELFRPSASPIHLVLSAQNPLCLYAAKLSKKQSQYIAAGNFCMTLRKHLEGSRLSAVEQVGLDRVVRLSFDRIEAGGEIVTKALYLELIPSAPNLILTEGGAILDVLVRGKKQHRELGFGKTYELPDGADRLDFLQFSKEEIADLLRFGKNQNGALKDFLYATFNGLSGRLVSSLFEEAGLSQDAPMTEISEEETDRLASAISSLAASVRAAEGLWLYGTGEKETASLLPLAGKEGTHAPSVSAWLAKAAAETGSGISASVAEFRKHLKSLIKKEERKEKKIAEELAETAQLERYKLWGNLLSIYSYMKAPGRTEITVDNPFDEAGGQETIPLSPELSLIGNSQAYFKRYGKMKTRLSVGQEKLAECRLKLDYLAEADYFAGEIRDRAALTALREELRGTGIGRYEKQGKNKPQKKKPSAEEPERLLVDGYTVWLGRNSRQNEFLTLHKAAKTDLWLHAQKIPGSHVVIEADGEIPDAVLEKAAAYAAWCSKGKDSGKVAVDYTLIKNVKKIKDGPLGLVNYTHQKTLVVAPEKPC